MREHTFRIVGNSEASSALQLERDNAPPQMKIWRQRRDSRGINFESPVHASGLVGHSQAIVDFLDFRFYN